MQKPEQLARRVWGLGFRLKPYTLNICVAKPLQARSVPTNPHPRMKTGFRVYPRPGNKHSHRNQEGFNLLEEQWGEGIHPILETLQDPLKILKPKHCLSDSLFRLQDLGFTGRRCGPSILNSYVQYHVDRSASTWDHILASSDI